MDELFDQLKAAGDAVRQHNQMFPYEDGGKYIHSMSINMVDGTGAEVHMQWDWFRDLWREHRYQAKASLHDGSWYHMSLMHRGVRCCAIARCDELKGLLANPLPKGSWSVWALMELFREECKAGGWDPLLTTSKEEVSENG